MQQGVVQRPRRAVHRVAGQERGDQPGRAGGQAHRDHERAVQQPSQQPRPSRPRSGGWPDHRPGLRPRTDPRTTEETGPMSAPARSSPADQFGEPDRVEGLERDHGHAPEQLDQHQAAQDRRRTQQSDAVQHDPRRRPHRGPDRRGGRVGRPRLADQQRAAHQVHQVQPDGDPERQQQRTLAADRVPGDEAAGGQRAEGDRQADHGPGPGQGLIHRNGGVLGVRGVDVPGLHRPRIERPIDPLQGRGQHKRRHGRAPRRTRPPRRC